MSQNEPSEGYDSKHSADGSGDVEVADQVKFHDDKPAEIDESVFEDITNQIQDEIMRQNELEKKETEKQAVAVLEKEEVEETKVIADTPTTEATAEAEGEKKESVKEVEVSEEIETPEVAEASVENAIEEGVVNKDYSEVIVDTITRRPSILDEKRPSILDENRPSILDGRPSVFSDRPSILDKSKNSMWVMEKLKKMSFNHYVSPSRAQLAALPLIMAAPDDLPFEVQLSINSVPILDNLATQLLRTFVTASYEEILLLTQMLDPEVSKDQEVNPDYESFQALIRLFSIAKSVYTRNEKDFIDVGDVAPGLWDNGETAPLALRGMEETIGNTIRKANLATFICGVINSLEVEFFSLDESFLDVFCPGKKNYTNAANGYGTIVVPQDLAAQKQFKGVKSGGGKLLEPQAELYLELKTQAYISAFLTHQTRDLAHADLEHLFPDNLEQFFVKRRDSPLLTLTESRFVHRCSRRKAILAETEVPEELAEKYSFDEFVQSLLEYMKNSLGMIVYGKRTNYVPSTTLWNNEKVRKDGLSSYTSSLVASLGKDFKTTDDLSKRVMEDVVSEKQVTKRPRKGTVRKAWTKEEEDALKEGLKVLGPHWVKIIEMHGPGGSHSEVLKNRNPTSLKDKSRNWKKTYLKLGQEVPDYLKGVPGELEQDSKKKAESKANTEPVPEIK